MNKCGSRCLCLATGILIGMAILMLASFILRGCLYIWCW